MLFEARQAWNPFYAEALAIVAQAMDEPRNARLVVTAVDDHGAADAERVVVVMGLVQVWLKEMVDALALPVSWLELLLEVGSSISSRRAGCRRSIPHRRGARSQAGSSSLPGAVGEPLYLEVVAVLHEAMDTDVLLRRRTCRGSL